MSDTRPPITAGPIARASRPLSLASVTARSVVGAVAPKAVKPTTVAGRMNENWEFMFANSTVDLSGAVRAGPRHGGTPAGAALEPHDRKRTLSRREELGTPNQDEDCARLMLLA